MEKTKRLQSVAGNTERGRQGTGGPRVLLNMASGTLDNRAASDTLWRALCTNGNLIRRIKSEAPQGQIAGIIVPVFDDGCARFPTRVSWFQKRNPNAARDARDLQTLCDLAARENIPVYGGVDVLAWQKSDVTSPTGLLNAEHPELHERGEGGGIPPRPEARFASPFHPQTAEVIQTLLREIAAVFPLASGVVLDVRLSHRDVSGFNPTARARFVEATRRDVQDIVTNNTAEMAITPDVEHWIGWRQNEMARFVSNLTAVYQNASRGKSVWVNGAADYYARPAFSHLRTGQDWQRWLRLPGMNGVILEGRWMEPFRDSDYLPLLHAARPRPDVLFLLSGNNLVGVNYQAEWQTISRRVPGLTQAAVLVQSLDDLAQAFALARGRIVPHREKIVGVGEPFPDVLLRDAQTGMAWRARSLRGKARFVALLMGDRLRVEASDGSVRVLQDLSHAMQERFGEGVHGVAVDNAGFVRETGKGKLAFPRPAPLPQEGQPAPTFVMRNALNRAVRLEDFRGKNVLVTFFPKCFTDGCVNHLSSLRIERQNLQAANVIVIAVSVDAADVQKEFLRFLQMEDFLFIPDTGRNLSTLFGAASDEEALSARMSVLIDTNGIVRLVDRRIRTGVHGKDILFAMRQRGMIPNALP